MPRDELDAAYADMYAHQFSDVFNLAAAAQFETDPTLKKQKTDALFNTTWPNNLKAFEARLIANGCGVIAGKDISYADLYLSTLLDFIGPKKDEILKAYPNIVALDKRVRALPKVAEWIAKRPPSEF